MICFKNSCLVLSRLLKSWIVLSRFIMSRLVLSWTLVFNQNLVLKLIRKLQNWKSCLVLRQNFKSWKFLVLKLWILKFLELSWNKMEYYFKFSNCLDQMSKFLSISWLELLKLLSFLSCLVSRKTRLDPCLCFNYVP